MTHELSRRHALTGAVGVGLGVPLLAGCGDDGTSSEADTSPEVPGDDGGGASGSAGDELVAAADVAVGGGAVLADQKVVVTQPSEGEFKAFSAACTHQGCLVDTVADGTINCPCHGSRFSIEDGSVQGGPATESLPEVEIVVEGGRVTLA